MASIKFAAYSIALALTTVHAKPESIKYFPALVSIKQASISRLTETLQTIPLLIDFHAELIRVTAYCSTLDIHIPVLEDLPYRYYLDRVTL